MSAGATGEETLENVPRGLLSSDDGERREALGPLLGGAKGGEVSRCASKCVTTCIRGGAGKTPPHVQTPPLRPRWGCNCLALLPPRGTWPGPYHDARGAHRLQGGVPQPPVLPQRVHQRLLADHPGAGIGWAAVGALPDGRIQQPVGRGAANSSKI